MHQQDIIEIHKGLQKAYIDNAVNSNLAYSPQFITNDYKRGVKILTHIENQLMHCDEFSISVAFINRSGFVELAETLKELERRGIRGRILTTDYLCFSEPYALDKLASLNIFNHQTNVDVDNRFTVYGIRDLGTELSPITMLVMMESIQNRIVENGQKGKATWLYIDEFHVLLNSEYSAKYLQQLWKKVRKQCLQGKSRI